jgi:type II secretory pathway pseudopilin PulG
MLRVTDPRSLRRTARSLAAFTMIEIALALGVIGFALVAIIGVLPAGMSVQKDNRESTLVNFDANFLLDAITTGATGLDDLTNHIIAITNYTTEYDYNITSGTTTMKGQTTAAYTPPPTGTFVNGSPASPATSCLTNGANIIALLTTPKYWVAGITPTDITYYSNYITADFRAISSSLADQGTSQSAQSFAFAYRIFPEVIPYAAAGEPWTNDPINNLTVATNFQINFTQIRIRFRWPIFANGGVGNSRLTFRTAVSGNLASGQFLPSSGWPVPTALIQPGAYVGQ